MNADDELFSPVIAQQITTRLLDWYRNTHRRLPWRQTQTPYHIWVSEVMLQQTQVSTVISYYGRFLRAFPTVCDLAAADLDEVLALWQGLGYYARARNLYRAAQIVCADWEGQLPRDHDSLLALPGIGEYTAGAIESIAYNQPVLALDANQRRVLCRLYDYAKDPTRAAGKRALQTFGRQLLSAEAPGTFNQAVMELGATICTSGTPKCQECPLRHFCRARHRSVQALRPLRSSKKRRPHKQYAYAYCQHSAEPDTVLIVRRPPSGLLGGLWELPGGEVAGKDPAKELRALLFESLGIDCVIRAKLASVRHGYSHFSLTATVYACQIEKTLTLQSNWDDHHWLRSDEQEAYGLSGVTCKILDALRWP